MNPEIASLNDRMLQGGNWKEFRDEIAALHQIATTEEEYVTLLEAFEKLVAVAEFAFDEETCANIREIAKGEYRSFLLKEAMEDDQPNPYLLDRITSREVEAGRLSADDELRKTARASAAVFGDSALSRAHRCKHGDWFFFGTLFAVILPSRPDILHITSTWLFGIGLFIGWLINYRENMRIKKDIGKKRVAEEKQQASYGRWSRKR